MPWAHLKATRQPRQQGLVELVEKSIEKWLVCLLTATLFSVKQLKTTDLERQTADR